MNNYFHLQEVRLYGMQNLAESATIISSYTPISADYGPNNLLTHLDNRSNRWDLPPLTAVATPATDFNSCYRADSTTISGPYVLGLDHGSEIDQNAVLLVYDLLTGDIGRESTLLRFFHGVSLGPGGQRFELSRRCGRDQGHKGP